MLRDSVQSARGERLDKHKVRFSRYGEVGWCRTNLGHQTSQGKVLDPLPGCVWLDTPGKVLHVEASRLEFREDAPA